jgi:hypothetical protein
MLDTRLAVDDEPAAPAPARAPAKPGLGDMRAHTRKALKNWPIVYNQLVDMHGWPLGVAALNPNYKPSPNGRIRGAGGPRLDGFSGPDYREETLGAWHCRGNGASGGSLVELIQYLSGGVEHRVAAEFLRDLVDRIVEVPV